MLRLGPLLDAVRMYRDAAMKASPHLLSGDERDGNTRPARRRPAPPAYIVDIVAGLVDNADMRDALAELEKECKVRRVAVRSQLPFAEACLSGTPYMPGARGQGPGVRRLQVRDGTDAKGNPKYKNNGLAIKMTPIKSENGFPSFKSALGQWLAEVRLAKAAGDAKIGPVVHDSFVCLHDDAPTGFIVMDYVRGVRIADFIESAVSEADRAKVRTAEAMFAEKLAALHAMGDIHGDIHAGNMMVVLDGTKKKNVKEVFLLDFGYSKNLEQSDMDEFAARKDGQLPAMRRRAVATEVARKLIAHGIILQ